MSIIYDALQKTQRQLNTKNQFKPVNYFRNWFDFILLITILILLIATCISYYPIIKKRIYNVDKKVIVDKAKPVIRPIPQPPIKLHLNGTFVSDQDKLAQINNRLFTVGESVEGNKILEITSRHVKLKGPNSIFYLEADPLT